MQHSLKLTMANRAAAPEAWSRPGMRGARVRSVLYPFLLSLLLGLGNDAARAGEGVLYDRFNRVVGSVDKNGVVRDRHYREVGRIGADGIITDRLGHHVGEIDKDTGVIRNRRKAYIGNVDADGVIRDIKGQKRGRIE